MVMSITAPRFDILDWKQEIESMTYEERSEAAKYLCGTYELIDEEPNFIQSKVIELNMHLERISLDKDAFLKAQQQLLTFGSNWTALRNTILKLLEFTYSGICC